MSEEGNRPSNDTPGDGAAAALALGAASRPIADRFLAEQTKVAEAQAEFIRLQSEDFRSDEAVRRRTLHLHHSSAAMKVAFEIAVALVVLLFIAIIGSAIWYAAHDDGLVVESFSVPPDLAARGLTGDVVAARLLDKLATLQAQTVSNRAASSYANNWGNDIKVQIPDTGISIGQAYQYLAQWLGNETHIRGEVFRDAKGVLTVTARAGASASPNFSGDESDFDKLLQQAAEAIYEKTQPYRFAVYLANHGRMAEAEAAYRALALNGSAEDRAWANIGLSTVLQAKGDRAGTIDALRVSLDVLPGFVMAYYDWANTEGQLQHDQITFDLERKFADIIRHGDHSGMDERFLAILGPEVDSALAAAVGDYQTQLVVNKAAEKLPEYGGQVENVRESNIQAYAFLHDGAGVSRAVAATPTAPGLAGVNKDASMMIAEYLLSDWGPVVVRGEAIVKELAPLGPLADVFTQRGVWPVLAVAKWEKGDHAGAEAMIGKTPVDCDLCVRLRGRIAALDGRWDAANYWYAMVSARSPTIPLADGDWGLVLLAHGQADAAIAKFESAHRKGPRYADPLEGWGEALMAKNRSDLALAKFEEAARYAPNWGRLHLKWGETLFYAGRKDEARKQFFIASGLDLSAAEKSELARLSH